MRAAQVRPGEGLRERKRRQTRERIAHAALELFLERGFEATTVDDIAAAAEVSKRSFFDYFPAKEDVVAAWQDGFGDTLAAEVAARPAGEPLAVVVEEALIAALKASTADPRAMALGRLIKATPALKARDQVKYARLELRLAEALAGRAGETDGLRTRLVAMIVVGAMRVAGELWRPEQAAAELEPFARRIFAAVWAELKALAGAAPGGPAGAPPPARGAGKAR